MNARLTEQEKILIRRALKARYRILKESGQLSRSKEIGRLLKKVERTDTLCVN